jgi:hypothetical protein
MKNLLFSTRIFMWLLAYALISMLVLVMLEESNAGAPSILRWAVFVSLWMVLLLSAWVMVVGYMCLARAVLFSKGEVMVFALSHLVFCILAIITWLSKGMTGLVA